MTRAVLCDIEGTIGSISFVKETLFPYSAEHLPKFVWRYRDDPLLAAELDRVASSTYVDRSDPDALIRKLLRWIEQDKKEAPLKTIQGMIWALGYKDGHFQSHVYEDAHRNLARWRETGLGLHIFSSGSVQAQKLYFRYSDHGDMRPLFTGWFDTKTGAKHESTSYDRIAAILDLPPEELLFLSDTPAELDAAAQAGLQTTWIRRPEDTPEELRNAFSNHRIAASFDEVEP